MEVGMASSMEWKDVATALFLAGWSAIGVYVAKSLGSLSDSVDKLNVNVAVVVEKVSNHERRIEKLEEHG